MQCLDTASERFPGNADSNEQILPDVTVRSAGFFFLCIVMQEPILPTSVSPCTSHVMWGTHSLAIFCNQQVPRQQKMQTAGTLTVIVHSNQLKYCFGYSVLKLISWPVLTIEICVILYTLLSRDITNRFSGLSNQHIY